MQNQAMTQTLLVHICGYQAKPSQAFYACSVLMN
jgi:hypothetical protein